MKYLYYIHFRNEVPSNFFLYCCLFPLSIGRNSTRMYRITQFEHPKERRIVAPASTHNIHYILYNQYVRTYQYLRTYVLVPPRRGRVYVRAVRKCYGTRGIAIFRSTQYFSWLDFLSLGRFRERMYGKQMRVRTYSSTYSLVQY